MIPELVVTETGNGRVTREPGGVLRLDVPTAGVTQYSNAQVASYHSARDFRYSPPLRLEVKARAEGELRGTAGFGFWNHPFAPGERGWRLPKTAWFFHGSPPNNMALAAGVPGSGWKAATLDATRWQFLALLPTAPVGVLLMRIPALYRRLWGIGQRAIGVSEYHLGEGLLREPHTYALEWRRDGLDFFVDGVRVHQTPTAPPGRLGLIAWVDNQYAVVTPQGQFGFGLVAAPEPQALVLEHLSITPLPDSG